MLLRYFNITAISTNPMTTLTRASQPPLLGSFLRYDGNAARKKNGDASPVANPNMPTTASFDCAEDTSSGPTKGPTQANEVSENVRPISSVPKYPPRREA